MEFRRLAETLDAVAKTTKRNEKKAIAAELLKDTQPGEADVVALFLAGRVFSERDERSLNISWRGLMDVVKDLAAVSWKDIEKHYEGDVGKAVASLLESSEYSVQTSLVQEPLSVLSVKEKLDRMASASGKGSARQRRALLTAMLSNASTLEMRYLVALILGDMRTGLSDGLLVDAIGQAYGIDEKTVRRAWSFSGSIGMVARIAAEEGDSGLQSITVQLFHPVLPMLATPVESVEEVLKETGDDIALELKLDGARVQVHKSEGNVRIYSRRLNDVTGSLPEIVESVKDGICAKTGIFDGEVVAVNEDGTPYPFQVVMKRFGRVKDVEEVSSKVRVTVVLFDTLMIEGRSLVDESYERRREALQEVSNPELLVEQVAGPSPEEAWSFFGRSRELGHEGLVAKRLSSPYVPGVRGRLWFKVKHALDTMDLVILAAEWGHGRRNKWLSDYHLAVLDSDTGEFVMIGKTFKGLTDDELGELTKELLKIKVSESGGLVRVRPEIVVEVLASEIQESPTYESGLAMRFARIKAIRYDKSPAEATTLTELHQTYESQFRFKAR
jgi:DNA ligase-1